MTFEPRADLSGSLSIRLLVWALATFAVLYVFGWTIGQPDVAVVAKAVDGSLVTKTGAYVRVLGDWYGAWIEQRFFDAPIASLIALGSSIAALCWITRVYVVVYSLF